MGFKSLCGCYLFDLHVSVGMIERGWLGTLRYLLDGRVLWKENDTPQNVTYTPPNEEYPQGQWFLDGPCVPVLPPLSWRPR